MIGPMGQDPNFVNDGNSASSARYVSGYNWGDKTDLPYPIRTGIFQSAIQIRRNSQMNLFNSVLTGYPVGLMIVSGAASNGNAGNWGQGSHAAATDGLLKVKNVFFAGMGQTGADANNTTPSWTGFGPDGEIFSETYFKKPELNNREFVPADQSYASILASIQELKLKDFQSKALPLSATGFAANNPNANWAPMAGSPLLGAADFTDSFLNDPFFKKVDYVGAFSGEDDNWLNGWTNFDPQNTVYE